MDAVLKQRVITGVVLVVAVLFGVLIPTPPIFAIFSMIVFISLSGWEWSRLVSLIDNQRTIFIVALLLVSVLVYASDGFRWFFIVLGVIIWMIFLILLAIYEKDTSVYKDNAWLLRLAAFLVLIPAWASLITLQQFYPLLVLYLVFLIAIADSGAYFSGKAFGKTKLAPELSPGKTREGMFGGLAGATIWSILGAAYFGLPTAGWLFFILLSMAVALFSVAGDLFESLIKREAGQKDSGSILPGHGGILDRIDGLLAALPLFTLGVFWGGIEIL